MLRRNDPFAMVNQIQRDMNRMFDARTGWAGGNDQDATYGEAEWVPAVDIQEAPDKWVLHADLPGVDPKSVEITVDQNVLRIKGERPAPVETEHEKYRRRERVTGGFFRQFTLTNAVNKEGISARSTNGVLTIAIPKAEAQQPRQITVEA